MTPVFAILFIIFTLKNVATLSWKDSIATSTLEYSRRLYWVNRRTMWNPRNITGFYEADMIFREPRLPEIVDGNNADRVRAVRDHKTLTAASCNATLQIQSRLDTARF